MKEAITVCYFVAFAGSLVLTFFDTNTQYVLLYSLVLLVIKSGNGLGFGFIYVIHNELFPTYFLATSFGFCNFFSQILTAFAPMIAEVKNVMVPLSLLIMFNLGGLGCAMFLKKRQTKC
jgi:hypothetical protein